jgi:hypothetical protein
MNVRQLLLNVLSFQKGRKQIVRFREARLSCASAARPQHGH